MRSRQPKEKWTRLGEGKASLGGLRAVNSRSAPAGPSQMSMKTERDAYGIPADALPITDRRPGNLFRFGRLPVGDRPVVVGSSVGHCLDPARRISPESPRFDLKLIGNRREIDRAPVGHRLGFTAGSAFSKICWVMPNAMVTNPNFGLLGGRAASFQPISSRHRAEVARSLLVLGE